MGHLADRVVVITGAGRGIGYAYARFCAGEGAKVVVNDAGVTMAGTDAEAALAAEVVEQITAAGGTAVADSHDVATEADAIMQTAIDAYGRIDGLVNNAGIIIVGGLEQTTEQQIRRMLDIHVMGSLTMIKAAWPLMRSQRHGRIVNVASAAVFGVAGGPIYPTAKGAIIGLTKAMARDGEDFDIKVNAVMPMGYSRMAETQAGVGEFMKAKFPAEAIAPFVGSLLVPQTPCTGEMFAVAGGRAARVFLATVPGLTGITSIDDCLADFDKIMSTDNCVVPTTMDEEIAYEYQCIGIDMSEIGLDFSELGTAT